RARHGTGNSRHGCRLAPHTAIAWLGLDGRDGIFLATAHPAKFRETVEPAVVQPVSPPAALAHALPAPPPPPKFRETVEPAIGETVSLPPALADALARRRCLHHISPLYANLQ